MPCAIKALYNIVKFHSFIEHVVYFEDRSLGHADIKYLHTLLVNNSQMIEVIKSLNLRDLIETQVFTMTLTRQ